MANRIAVAQTKNGLRKTSSQSGNLNEEIAKVAYQLFVERGHKHGHDREDWLRAEAIVKKRNT